MINVQYAFYAKKLMSLKQASPPLTKHYTRTHIRAECVRNTEGNLQDFLLSGMEFQRDAPAKDVLFLY